MKATIGLLLCSCASAGNIIDAIRQPDYRPELPTALFAAPLPRPDVLRQLQSQSPQDDYAQYWGVTCYFPMFRPSQHDVCATQAIEPWSAPVDPAYVAPPRVVPVSIKPPAASEPRKSNTPEPGSAVLMLLGGVALVAMRTARKTA